MVQQKKRKSSISIRLYAPLNLKVLMNTLRSVFVICFDIRMCDISSSILSQEYFGYLGPFVIPYEFYCFFSFCKNVIGILLGMH